MSGRGGYRINRRARTLPLRFQQGAEYLLFAAGGFTPELEQRVAREKKVHLISAGDLLEGHRE